jgi:hypothetical protein
MSLRFTIRAPLGKFSKACPDHPQENEVALTIGCKIEIHLPEGAVSVLLVEVPLKWSLLQWISGGESAVPNFAV